MDKEDKIVRGREILEELADIVSKLTNSQVIELFDDGALSALLKAILDPADCSSYPSVNEFLLANRERAALLAALRYAITHNYSFVGVNVAGASSIVSPSHVQWFSDGVMFLQGTRPFEGHIGLYREDKSLSYAIAARDIRPGYPIGPEHFEFIHENEYRQRLDQLAQVEISRLDEPVRGLESLLNEKENDESKYQELLEEYPWALGLQYRSALRHPQLDSRNIPDFTAVRVHDRNRDIIEIKPPFTSMFRQDGEPSSSFNDAWNQAERYLDFARLERDYLLRQGFSFDRPKCYLILGFNLTESEINRIRTKERMNPAIRLLTYNDLLAFMRSTIAFVRRLKVDEGAPDTTQASSADEMSC